MGQSGGSRLQQAIASPHAGRRIASIPGERGTNLRERRISLDGGLSQENYLAFVIYSNKEYHFGSPEVATDSQDFDVTVTKGLSYPFPVYTHECRNRYLLRRTASDIRMMPAKMCVVSIILSGEIMIRQNGRAVRMSSNQLTVIDLSEPYLVDLIPYSSSGFKSIYTYVPSGIINSDVCPSMPRIIEMSDDKVAAISALLQTLFDHGLSLPHLSAQSVFDAILLHINSGSKLTQSRHSRKSENSTSDDERWYQVISYINLMYSNSLLDLASVAQEIGISQRSLNYLFSQHGTTFSQTLWDLRLSIVRDWLSDPSMNNMAIQQMAAAAGFKSAAHLSTFFKSRMSYSPREFRRRMGRR